MKAYDLFERECFSISEEQLAEDFSAAKRFAKGTALAAGMTLAGAHTIDAMLAKHQPPGVDGPRVFQSGDWQYGDESTEELERGDAPSAKAASASPRAAPIKAAVHAAMRSTGVRDPETLILALTMWGEARNLGREGMESVGHVIINRSRADNPGRFGNGVIGVALHDQQFSCWNRSDPNLGLMGKIDHLDAESSDEEMWKLAVKLARQIAAGRSHDPTKGATYYHASDVNPFWAPTKHYLGKWGSHLFYREAKPHEDVASVQFAKIAQQKAKAHHKIATRVQHNKRA